MDLTMPTWMDFLDKYIFDIFGYYRSNISIFHFRQQCLHVLHIITMDPSFYNCGGMKLVCGAILIYVLRRNFIEYELEISKQTNSICLDNNEIKLCMIKNNEEKLINDILAESNVQPTYINEIVRKISNTFENFRKNQESYMKLGIKHIFKLFNNAKLN